MRALAALAVLSLYASACTANSTTVDSAAATPDTSAPSDTSVLLMDLAPPSDGLSSSFDPSIAVDYAIASIVDLELPDTATLMDAGAPDLPVAIDASALPDLIAVRDLAVADQTVPVDSRPFGDFAPPPDQTVIPDLTCVPFTCTGLHYECGVAADGCGNTLDCGSCTKSGDTCGGGGVQNTCGQPCMPATCKSLNYNCGAASDTCGGVISCGVCPTGKTCGLVQANRCG